MSDLRWWLHSQRPKHLRRMSTALAKVERGYYYKRTADRERNSELLVEGWREIKRAIHEVVECGCPRRLWPEKVREVIKEP